MKIYICLYICLLAWAEAKDFKVNTKNMEGYDASVVDIYKQGDNYIIDFRKPFTEDSICLEMRFQKQSNTRQSEKLDGNLCDDDTSTKVGTLSTIVRSSMGIDCPIDVGTYTGPDEFQSEGELDDSSAGVKSGLRVTAYESVDGQANHNKPLFSASYDIIPSED